VVEVGGWKKIAAGRRGDDYGARSSSLDQDSSCESLAGGKRGSCSGRRDEAAAGWRAKVMQHVVLEQGASALRCVITLGPR
jgi:hypothetical protein